MTVSVITPSCVIFHQHVHLHVITLSVHALAGHRSVNNNKQKRKRIHLSQMCICICRWLSRASYSLLFSVSFVVSWFPNMPPHPSPPSLQCVCGSASFLNPHCGRCLLGSFKCSLLSCVCESVFLNLFLPPS